MHNHYPGIMSRVAEFILVQFQFLLLDILRCIRDNDFLSQGFIRMLIGNVSFRPERVTLPNSSSGATGSGNSSLKLNFLGFLKYKIIYETLPILKPFVLIFQLLKRISVPILQ